MNVRVKEACVARFYRSQTANKLNILSPCCTAECDKQRACLLYTSCVHTGGAVDRHTAEPEDVRRRGAAGGVHRRRRQRHGDAGAGAAEVACCVCKNRKACHCRAGAYTGAAICFQNAQSLLSHPRVRHTARIRKKFRQRKIPPQMRRDLVETAGLEPVTSCV